MSYEFGEKVPTLCYVCVQPVPEGSNARVGGVPACPSCAEGVARQDAETALGAKYFAPGVVGGLIGAALGALIWAGIAIGTGLEIGYVAVLVGALAGLGVRVGARKGRSPVLQIAAAAMAAVGLVLAKYFIVAWFIHKEFGEPLLSGAVFSFFVDNVGETLSVHDFLWFGLAVFTAWKIPAPNSK